MQLHISFVACAELAPPQAHKWTHHVFFWMLDTAIVNAYELYVSYYNKDRKRYNPPTAPQAAALPGIDQDPEVEEEEGACRVPTAEALKGGGQARARCHHHRGVRGGRSSTLGVPHG